MQQSSPDYPVNVRSPPAAWCLALFYLFSVLGTAIGESTNVIPGVSAMFWLPVGMLLAMLLVSPPSAWPWWALASVAAELTGNQLWWGNPWLPSLGYAGANVLEAAVGAGVLRHFAKERSFLRKPSDTALFVVICGMLAPTISATFIAGIDVLTGRGPFLRTWSHIWLGDAAGALVATPLTLVALEFWRYRASARVGRVLEILLLGILIVAVALAALDGRLPTLYLTLPLLLWAGIRFQMRGAMPALGLLVLVCAVFLSQAVTQPPAGSFLEERVVGLQVFFAVSAISVLFAAVLAHQHEETRLALRKSNEILEARVAERTARLASALRAGRLGIVELDLARQSARLDPTARELFGTTDAEIALPVLAGRIHSADRDGFVGRLDQAGSGGAADRIAIECRVGEKNCRWIAIDAEHAPAMSSTWVGIVRDVSDSIDAQRRQQMLIGELSHRMKNTLSMVQAIAMQTLKGRSEPVACEEFLARIAALARGHDLLARQGWESANLDELVGQAVLPFGPERFDLHGDGSRISLTAAQALAIALALHELCANAAKYGALSQPGGRVKLCWEQLPQDRRFRLVWQESGGPGVRARRERGFGSVLLEELLAQDLRGRVVVSYPESGVECEIDAPITAPRPSQSIQREMKDERVQRSAHIGG